MAVEVSVRVTRTWDVKVEAEYGDTDETLCARAIELVESREENSEPDAQDVRVLPDYSKIIDQSEFYESEEDK